MAFPNQEMPHNIDAETAVLGAILSGHHQNMALELISQLKADDFYDGFHRAVYKAIAKLVGENKDVSLVTVSHADKNLSPSKLASIYNSQALPEQFGYYAEILKELSTRRKLIMFGIKSQELARKTGGDLGDILADIEKTFFNITKHESAEWEMNLDLMLRHQKELEHRYTHKGEIQGVKTGFIDLDKMTSGWGKGQLIFLGAVPKMGKTSMGLHFALNSNQPTLFFTLEMLPEEIADRQISSKARVEGDRIKNGDFEDDHWQRTVEAAKYLSKLPIGWVKKSGMTVTEIRAVCRRFQAEHGLGLVVIDQLDKIYEPKQKGELKTDAIGRITSQLKNMARDLEVPVIVLLQLLDKQMAKRSTPRPTFGDIRDSSCPDQDGDVVMFLWRPEFYWPNKDHLKNKAEIIVSRQRSGKTGSVWVNWMPDYTLFTSMAKEFWPKEEELK